MTKTVKTIRLDDDVIRNIENYANDNGLTFSQVVNSCILDKFKCNDQPSETKPIRKTNNNNHYAIRLNDTVHKKLIDVVNNKKNTLSQEIRFRVLASLDNPCFDTLELKELRTTRNNLNQLGNLIKLSINQNKLIHNEQVSQLQNEISQLKEALKKIIVASNERIM